VHRFSPTLRALVFVPLLAVGVDQTRAVVLCGSDAQGCLEAAGRGWLGLWGVALIAAYALALGLTVARVPAGPRPGFRRLWAVGTVGVLAACGGQALIADALGGAPLGGGWLGLVALCAVAGALLALALRVRPAPSWRAPRPGRACRTVWLAPARRALARVAAPTARPRGRAPPLTV
jgi:hypothetical protein